MLELEIHNITEPWLPNIFLLTHTHTVTHTETVSQNSTGCLKYPIAVLICDNFRRVSATNLEQHYLNVHLNVFNIYLVLWTLKDTFLIFFNVWELQSEVLKRKTKIKNVFLRIDLKPELRLLGPSIYFQYSCILWCFLVYSIIFFCVLFNSVPLYSTCLFEMLISPL